MWYYEGKLFDIEKSLGDNIGFVYLITNLTNGKKYIGKKLFQFTRTKKIKGKKKKTKIQSDWMDYYGSNTTLLEDVKKIGKNNFKREIIRLCKTKGTCTYFEIKEILTRDALISEDYYNGWISAKVSRSQIKL